MTKKERTEKKKKEREKENRKRKQNDLYLIGQLARGHRIE